MKGQVAIVVLLVSAVMLTMGLSLSKRATVETKINSDEELLKKAFNAAESGVDYFLGTGRTSYSSPDSFSGADISVQNIGQGATINFNEYVPVGNRDLYWLVNHDDNGDIGATYYSGATLNVCGVAFTGSIAVDYFYKNGALFGVRRYGFNFSADPSYRVSGFTDSVTSCVTVPTNSPAYSPLLISLTPIFDGGKFYLEGGGGATFSSQGFDISSVGRAGGVSVGVGRAYVNKSISVRKRYKIPSFLLTGIMAEGSVLSD